MGVLTGPYVSQLILQPEKQRDKPAFGDPARTSNHAPLSHASTTVRYERHMVRGADSFRILWFKSYKEPRTRNSSCGCAAPRRAHGWHAAQEYRPQCREAAAFSSDGFVGPQPPVVCRTGTCQGGRSDRATSARSGARCSACKPRPNIWSRLPCGRRSPRRRGAALFCWPWI